MEQVYHAEEDPATQSELLRQINHRYKYPLGHVMTVFTAIDIVEMAKTQGQEVGYEVEDGQYITLHIEAHKDTVLI